MKDLKLLVILIIAALINVPYFSYAGDVARQEREVKDFTRVNFACSGDLELVQGDEESLIIEADEDVIDFIVSEVEDGTLVIKLKKKAFGLLCRDNQGSEFKLTMKQVDGISVSGSGNVKCDGISTGNIDMNVSGSGEIKLEKLIAKDITMTVRGSGEIEVNGIEGKNLAGKISGSGDVSNSGKVDSQTFSISGSGEYTAGDLVTENTSINISGSGNARVYAVTALSVSISGSGNVKYQGSPVVTKSISGSGSVKSLD